MDQNYDPIDGTHDIHENRDRQYLLLNKVFESETIDNGALSIELSGFDTNPAGLLIPEMFESKNTI